jgi:hypothetical protein
MKADALGWKEILKGIVGQRKASGEGITRNPRGLTRRAGVTNLPCRFRRALIRVFMLKAKLFLALHLLFDTPRPRFKGYG